jgi:hypothetical protein
MAAGKFIRHAANTFGPNHEYHIVWDLAPEGGKPPLKLCVNTTDANEYVERDPARYVFGHPDDTAPPSSDDGRVIVQETF